jgi:hypothetical protein
VSESREEANDVRGGMGRIKTGAYGHCTIGEFFTEYHDPVVVGNGIFHL